MKELFSKISSFVAKAIGSPIAFILAVFLIITWAFTGPMFNYSQTWQLLVNTGTTILTFLIVFLIQGSQNRESMAVQLKLDALIEATEKADNKYINLDKVSIQELEEYVRVLREKADVAECQVEKAQDALDKKE